MGFGIASYGVRYPGEHTIVMTANSDAANVGGVVRIHASDGIDIKAIETGTGGFDYRAESTHTEAHAIVPLAEASALSSVSVRTERPLFGIVRLPVEGFAVYQGSSGRSSMITDYLVLYAADAGEHSLDVYASVGMTDYLLGLPLRQGWRSIGAPAGADLS